MNNKILALVALAAFPLYTFNLYAQPIEKSRVEVMNAITVDVSYRPYQSNFPEPIRANLIRTINHGLDHHSPITLFGATKTWQSLDKVKSLTEPGIQVLKMELSSEQFSKGKLTVSGVKEATLYQDGEVVSGEAGVYSLSLVTGDHRLLLVTEQVDNWKKLELDWKNDAAQDTVTFQSGAVKHRLNAEQVFDSQTYSGLSISPDGQQMVWTKKSYSAAGGDRAISQTELLDTKTLKVLYRWQAMTPGSLNWSPDNHFISYSADNDVYLLARNGFALTTVATALEGASGFNWLNKDTLIFSWIRADKSDFKVTKHYRALEDRWGGWRNNSQIFVLDIHSGLVKQLTQDKVSHNLLDMDDQHHRILISRERVDYKAPAHGLTELVEFDLSKHSEKILGSYRTFSGAAYGKAGIYITAGPGFSAANGKGRDGALADNVAVNNYDGQLYLMDPKGQVSALSSYFDPAIGGFEVLANDDLLLRVNERDRTVLYYYGVKGKKFTRIEAQLDVVDYYSVSEQKDPTIIYAGSTATSPQKVFLKTAKGKPRLLVDTAQVDFANTSFSELKEWPFKNAKGETIDGRYYLPPNFDKNKQYPAIVYYYGGTSSVQRAFSGRWPYSLWAAQGYVVYVLQPSGATGYGQKFSAKHVNAWGKETADDIISATKAFIKEHPFVDPKRVGNMGASYGGFMTMYLATQTDMFAASISHAGISNLAEYWGYGWWGYAYSGVASQGSFPWNNRQLYTEQSPIFSADKITTPLLLLHGDSDTNVPVTESHQMYTALKLQDKDVEFVEFAGDDHHINSRSHRLVWWNTILAYFDLKLKEQPLWWETLYPPAK